MKSRCGGRLTSTGVGGRDLVAISGMFFDICRDRMGSGPTKGGLHYARWLSKSVGLSRAKAGPKGWSRRILLSKAGGGY